jgi:hypothetical protein
MKTYNKLNNLLGWLMFAVSFVVYLLTLEPSVSLWDCGEFISAAHKLQVVHPPGAPFFLLLGNFFSNFALGNPENVGWAVNMMSALVSALTVLFTFWITSYFAKKIRIAMDETDLTSTANKLLIFGSAAAAALTLTFSDTFWFSAVEAEVYALSSFFTALTFWAMLKWESKADTDPYADRWLIFIAYMIGLAIGTHLLNLLVIPTIAIIYYFKRYEYSRLGLLSALGIGAGVLLLIQKLLIPGLPWLAANLDHVLVNSAGMPFYSGAIVLFLLVIGGLGYGIWFTIKNKKRIYNLIFIAISFMVLGYSSYAMVVIRSAANTAIDMNNPEDLYNLLSYINREQYGDRPLAYGPWFNSQPDNIEVVKEEYAMNEKTGEYEKVRDKRDYTYPDAEKTPFPRMGDANKQNGDIGYRIWGGMDKVQNQIQYQQSLLQDIQRNPTRPGAQEQYQQITETINKLKTKKPTMGNNLTFLFKYQIGHMYLRYFMWNFVGRQNDNQSDINKLWADGNWLSGISFIDNIKTGNSKYLPKEMAEHPSRNTYFALPLIFGLIGLFFQLKKSKGDFLSVLTLFFFTGLAIIIFLNQPPFEPRERDYSHVGSFQTFCIWVGLGVMGLASFIERRLNATKAAGVSLAIVLLGAPVLMAQQNWDDHDRSGRYLGIDYAKNYLASCAPNAILFCNGDNDTYPLWYAQNVEGIRTDVRIINLALFPTDWYAGSLKRKVYKSEPFDMQITMDQLKSGAYDYLPYQEMPGIDPEKTYELSKVIDFMLNDAPANKVQTRDGQSSALPTRNFAITIDKNEVLNNGVVQIEDSANIVDRITFTYPSTNGIHKGDLALLDLIAQNAENGWKRPIYFTAISGAERVIGLSNFMQLEGLAYRLVPVKNNGPGNRRLAKNIMYDKIMNEFRWSGMKEKDNFFVDEKASYVPHSMRQSINELARLYTMDYMQSVQDTSGIGITPKAKEAQKRAIALLDKSLLEIPERVLPFNRPEIKMNYGVTYLDLGETEKGTKLLTELSTYLVNHAKYYKSQRGNKKNWWDQQLKPYYGQVIGEMIRVANQKGLKELESKLKTAQTELG